MGRRWGASAAEYKCRERSIFNRTGQEAAGHLGQIGDVPSDGTGCAVVLPDEGLLVPVLNSIPEDIRDINVTMGLPMGGSRLYSMMTDISAIQLHVISRKGKWYFYHKQVWSLFSNTLFRAAADRDSLDAVASVKSQAKYYIPQEELAVTPLLGTVFSVAVTDPKARSAEQIALFSEYLKDVIKAVASHVPSDGKSTLELEYAKEYYRCVNMLQEKKAGGASCDFCAPACPVARSGVCAVPRRASQGTSDYGPP